MLQFVLHKPLIKIKVTETLVAFPALSHINIQFDPQLAFGIWSPYLTKDILKHKCLILNQFYPDSYLLLKQLFNLRI